MVEKDCKACGDSFIQYRSTQNLCDNCAYDKAIRTSSRSRRGMINHKGKVTKQWLDEDRPKWIKNHPPNHQGYWECYLGLPGCRHWITIAHLTLDHKIARSRDPSKRRKQSKLHPACLNCNYKKGSMSLAQVKKKYPMSRIALGVESAYGV